MQYYRCRCGKKESYGSMGPRPCQGCRECNTTLSIHPGFHETPEPHEPVDETTTITRNGVTETKTRRYCSKCLRDLPEQPDE